tara:strand:- start:5095 stop:6300 length:1206 start_codon:yes stop_codon:yes gene_type:complete
MIELYLALTGLFFSALFSGGEIAFIQANLSQLQVWEKQKHRFAKKTVEYRIEPERFLTVVLIGTNLANILTTSYATLVLLKLSVHPIITVIIITGIILLFGEILPKVLFRDFATISAKRLTPIIQFSEILLKPIVKGIQIYSKWLIPENSKPISTALNREDLRLLFENVDIGEELDLEEKKVISNILKLGSRPVRKALTPQSDVVTISSESSVDDAIKLLMDTGFSKLPLYGSDVNNIIGIIFLHDLFTNPHDLKSIAKKPIFISENLLSDEALELLKRKNSSIAIVKNNQNQISGIVTVEDLIEELFGEFEDVFDETGKKITKLNANSLIVDSMVEIDELRKQYGFRFPSGNYETIGGYLLSKIGRIPKAGETFNLDWFHIKILRANPARVEKLYIVKNR